MRHHTENNAVRSLRAIGIKFKNKVIEAKAGSLGIKAWGLVDYLCGVHKYVIAIKKT